MFQKMRHPAHYHCALIPLSKEEDHFQNDFTVKKQMIKISILLCALVNCHCCSTVSSGLNSLAAVTMEDIVKGSLNPSISEEKATQMAKILGP